MAPHVPGRAFSTLAPGRLSKSWESLCLLHARRQLPHHRVYTKAQLASLCSLTTTPHSTRGTGPLDAPALPLGTWLQHLPCGRTCSVLSVHVDQFLLKSHTSVQGRRVPGRACWWLSGTRESPRGEGQVSCPGQVETDAWGLRYPETRPRARTQMPQCSMFHLLTPKSTQFILAT